MSHFESLLSGAYDIAIDLKVDADTRVFLTRVDASAKCGFGTPDKFPYLDVALPLTAGRVALAGGGPGKYVFTPDEFFSRVPGNALFLETDFTSTDLCIIYGPYATLPRGEYIARFYVTAVDFGSQNFSSSITFDVARDETLLASRKISKLKGQSDLRSGVIVIPFSNGDPNGLFEFRLSTKGEPYKGSLRFFGVTVESTSVGDSERQRRAHKLHLGELMSLLVQLVAERFGPPRLRVQMENKARVDLANNGALDAFLRLRDAILIAPFSNKATRDWPIHYYTQLIHMVSSKFTNPIGLLGAAEHYNALDEIVAQNGDNRLYNLAGKIEWSELPQIFENASVVISNNSGVAHFAAACGTSLLAIYSGAVLAEEWAPRGEGAIVTISVDVPCSPCGYDKLEDCSHNHRCMKLISVDSVFAELAKLIEATPCGSRS